MNCLNSLPTDGQVFYKSFLKNQFRMQSYNLSSPCFVITSPGFFKGKSKCRVRVFVESGFSAGPSPSPVRVS